MHIVIIFLFLVYIRTTVWKSFVSKYDKLVAICSQRKETIDSLLKRLKEPEAVTRGQAFRNQQQQKAPLVNPSSLIAFTSSGDVSDSFEEYHTDDEELEKVTSSQTRERCRPATKTTLKRNDQPNADANSEHKIL
jgi:hypothetical protein